MVARERRKGKKRERERKEQFEGRREEGEKEGCVKRVGGRRERKD